MKCLGPAKKAPEEKLSAIQHTVDTSVVGAADAYVVSLHWLLRADETENLLLGMTSLVLHGSETDPGDVTLRVPTSKTDPRGNGASRRLTCICKLLAGVGDPTPDACPACAVRRQVSRLRLLVGWVLDDDSETRPLFPRVDGSRASKAQLVEAWGVVTSQNDKPTGHSPRRFGAKRYARQGWSVWMIQFMGRWAASTVLEYIEEAMAEVTACWARLPVSCPSGELEASEACRLAGTKGGCPKLSERVDRIEQIILDTRERLAQSESQGGRLSQKMLEIEDQVLANYGCGRLLTTANGTALCTQLLGNLWSGRTLSGRRNAGGDLVRHTSICDGAGRRCVLVGGCVRGAHEESCGYDARLRQ